GWGRGRGRGGADGTFHRGGGRAGKWAEPVRQRQRPRCRSSPSFPCSVRAVRRYPGTQLPLERANLFGGLREFHAKTTRLPDLKLVTEAGTGDLVLDANVSFERLGEDRSPLAVDLQNLARAVKRRRELLALFGIGWKARDQRLHRPEKSIAARVERGAVERRKEREALKPFAREHRAKGRRDRDPPLGVEPQGVVRHEAVHDAPGAPPPVAA